jgi:O-antigen/teichoic acid export membrane protein
MYWQTSAWIAVATFPALAVSVALATPLTVFLFGDAYADAGTVLAVLAVGHYISAALGFNALTLRVQGSVRYIVGVDVVAAAVSVAASLLLIERFGAMGAAVATSTTLIVQNLLYQVGLARSTVGLPDRRHAVTFVGIAVAVAGLTVLQIVFGPPLLVGIVVAGLVALALLAASRRSLEIGRYFPELLKVPVLRSLIGGSEIEGRRVA